MNGKKLLISALVVQSVMIIGLWYGPRAQTAQAEIPDAAGQLVQVSQQISSTNDKLDKIISLLQDGKIQVSLAKPDDK